MRLIDADAEIVKVKERLKHYKERLDKNRECARQEPNNPYVNWTNKINGLYDRIGECEDEVERLNSYKTIYATKTYGEDYEYFGAYLGDMHDGSNRYDD